MPFLDTRPAPIGDDDDGELASFRVDHPREILRLIRELIDGALPVNLSAPGGIVLTTTLWTVDSESRRLTVNAEADDPALQRLIESDEVTAVAYLEAVKLQFELRDLMLVRGARTTTLQTRLPTRLYRFQRRGTFRVRTLSRTSPTALMRHPAIPEMQLALRVLDVSIGGCALLLPDSVPALPAGVRVNQVHLDLDADTRLTVTLLLHHVTSIQPHSSGVRLGCELVQLDSAAERTLQRYIDHTQKRRRLLSPE
jgi:flagellar brake protein